MDKRFAYCLAFVFCLVTRDPAWSQAVGSEPFTTNTVTPVGNSITDAINGKIDLPDTNDVSNLNLNTFFPGNNLLSSPTTASSGYMSLVKDNWSNTGLWAPPPMAGNGTVLRLRGRQGGVGNMTGLDLDLIGAGMSNYTGWNSTVSTYDPVAQMIPRSVNVTLNSYNGAANTMTGISITPVKGVLDQGVVVNIPSGTSVANAFSVKDGQGNVVFNVDGQGNVSATNLGPSATSGHQYTNNTDAANLPEGNVDPSVTASGTTLQSARALVKQDNFITSALAGSGISLPNVQLGVTVRVVNRSGVTVEVYPFSTSDQIEQLGQGNPIEVANGRMGIFERDVALHWYQIY